MMGFKNFEELQASMQARPSVSAVRTLVLTDPAEWHALQLCDDERAAVNEGRVNLRAWDRLRRALRDRTTPVTPDPVAAALRDLWEPLPAHVLAAVAILRLHFVVTS